MQKVETSRLQRLALAHNNTRYYINTLFYTNIPTLELINCYHHKPYCFFLNVYINFFKFWNS